MRHPCSMPHGPLIRDALQWVRVSIRKNCGETLLPPSENSPLVQHADCYLLWPQPSSFLLLQNSSRVSSTLDSLSPFCQLIDENWVLKLEVLVGAQSQLRWHVGFFPCGDSVYTWDVLWHCVCYCLRGGFQTGLEQRSCWQNRSLNLTLGSCW